MPGIEPLLNLGAIGAVLAWFLVNLSPRLDRIERAIDRLTRAQMLTLLSRPDVPEGVKTLANDLVHELDRSKASQEAA